MQDKATKLLVGLVLFAVAASCGGCGQSLVPPLPEVVPFPVAKVLTADEQRKAIDDMIAKKDREAEDAERQIKQAR